MKLPTGETVSKLRKSLRERALYTVCEEARCPNLGECWDQGTATIMLMGDVCTRGCRFCAVKTGNPRGWLDYDEPAKVAQTAEIPGLRYLVLTSVDRDDLPDYGAGHYAKTIRLLKERRASLLVEALVPDFQGRHECVHVLCDSGVDVYAHNIETVDRLHRRVRDVRATYRQTLDTLAEAKRYRPDVFTKSSIMLGLGEAKEEIRQTMHDLREHGVDILTLGQYLQPNKKLLSVERYITPEEFDTFKRWAEEDYGFAYCASGPMVRSSYKAAEHFVMSKLLSGEGLPQHETSDSSDASEVNGFAGRMVV
ncbi:MAG: lipoyl synthase [Planctomycetes bacterium]|nr:lipoyl synthase [Planctomycetota bacterium]